jgi:hypothetical protein
MRLTGVIDEDEQAMFSQVFFLLYSGHGHAR